MQLGERGGDGKPNSDNCQVLVEDIGRHPLNEN